MAILWQANGNVRKLPGDHQRWESEGPIAAVFDDADFWVEDVRAARPTDPIFVSKNGIYFVVPWFSRDKLIGLWVLDMAYWGGILSHPDVPSLAFTKEILDALGPAMDAIQIA
jgi:hypothetical protein